MLGLWACSVLRQLPQAWDIELGTQHRQKIDLCLMPAESTSAEAVECCSERRQRSAARHTQICGAALSGMGRRDGS